MVANRFTDNPTNQNTMKPKFNIQGSRTGRIHMATGPPDALNLSPGDRRTMVPAPKTDSTVTTVTRKIGSNRGKARLWIEGVCLSSQGWVKGREFRLFRQSGFIEMLALDEAPAIASSPPVRKVAGTTDRPIIDTNTDALLTTLGVAVGDVVHITINPGIIVVRKFDPATDGKAQAMTGKH